MKNPMVKMPISALQNPPKEDFQMLKSVLQSQEKIQAIEAFKRYLRPTDQI